jgi:hydroxymethylpyrimidine/phosphomethylpyrimidine kinase
MKDPKQQRSEVIYRLNLAVSHLEASMSPLLIPDDGASFGYAVMGARDRDGVAAVPGGMILRDGKVTAGAPCAFGGDEPCARIILTVMKTDPLMRCAAAIRYSENILGVFEGMLLDCKPLDRSRKAQKTSTMDWGAASCCNDGVPDIIYDKGGDEKPGILYIFGEDPVVVANNIIICSNRMLSIAL